MVLFDIDFRLSFKGSWICCQVIWERGQHGFSNKANIWHIKHKTKNLKALLFASSACAIVKPQLATWGCNRNYTDILY